MLGEVGAPGGNTSTLPRGMVPAADRKTDVSAADLLMDEMPCLFHMQSNKSSKPCINPSAQALHRGVITLIDGVFQ